MFETGPIMAPRKRKRVDDEVTSHYAGMSFIRKAAFRSLEGDPDLFTRRMQGTSLATQDRYPFQGTITPAILGQDHLGRSSPLNDLDGMGDLNINDILNVNAFPSSATSGDSQEEEEENDN